MTQANSDNAQRRRAEFHLARATSYREDANLMLERYNKSYSAAALLYESAKQCINAVANLRGQNPGAVGAKRARFSETSQTRLSPVGLIWSGDGQQSLAYTFTPIADIWQKMYSKILG